MDRCWREKRNRKQHDKEERELSHNRKEKQTESRQSAIPNRRIDTKGNQMNTNTAKDEVSIINIGKLKTRRKVPIDHLPIQVIKREGEIATFNGVELPRVYGEVDDCKSNIWT